MQYNTIQERTALLVMIDNLQRAGELPWRSKEARELRIYTTSWYGFVLYTMLCLLCYAMAYFYSL